MTFTVSILTLLCIWAFGHEISKMLGTEAISNWLYLIPVTVLLTGIYQTLNYWSNRKKQYARVAISRICMSVTTAGVFLGMGFARMGASGFLVGSILGQSVATGLLGWQGWKEDKKYRKFISKTEIIQYFNQYRDFLIFNSPTALLNSISQSLPILIMSSSFDSSTVGLYGLSVRVIYLPLNLISSSVEQVFFQRVTEKYRDGDPLKPQLYKIALTFALIYFFPVIILTLFGIDLFAFVFGEQWKKAGEFSQILVIPFAFKAVVSPLTMAILAAGKIKLGSLWHVLYFITISITLFLASKLCIESFLVIFALHELILYTIYFCLTLVAIRRK
jgi:O-antigen/teichoic acid export membrane protein